MYNANAIIQPDILMLKTGAKNFRYDIKIRAIIIFANMVNRAILKGVLVSPFEKKIGVNILCRTNAGKPIA